MGEQRYQLYRFGEWYASWGTREEVIERQITFMKRPWWWLRLWGWDVKPEPKPIGFIGHSVWQMPPDYPVDQPNDKG